MSIQIQVEGNFDEFVAVISNLSNFDKRNLNQVLSEVLRESTIERFQNEEAPDGTRWQRSLRARMTGNKTLSQTSQLKNSLSTYASEEGFALGTNTKYARIHQYGGTIDAKSSKGLIFKINGRFIRKQSVTIPKREFLGLSEEDKREIAQTIQDFVSEVLE